MVSKFAVNKLISLKHHNYFSPLSTFYLEGFYDSYFADLCSSKASMIQFSLPNSETTTFEFLL